MDYENTQHEAQEPTAPEVSSKDLQALGEKLYRQYLEAKKWFAPAAKKAREHRDFYDADQWTDKQKAEMEKQGRPPVVINSIFKAINNVSGKQRDARLDYKALPMSKDDVLAAHLATRGLDYLEGDDSKFTESEVFLDALKGPVGWAKVVYDDTDPNEEDVRLEYKTFEEMLYDPFGKKKDLTDFRYVIELRDTDLDSASADHPQFKETLRRLAQERQDTEAQEMTGDYGNRDDGHMHYGSEGELPGEDVPRLRVMLREHHYWEVEETLYWLMPNGDKIDFDPADPAPDKVLLAGGQKMKGRKRCFYYAIMAGRTILHHAKSTYPFARFPYAALWAFRDRKGRPYGLIENMVWPQRERNVAHARANEAARARHALVKKGSLTPGELDRLSANLARANFVMEIAKPEDVIIGDDKGDVAMWLQMEANAANWIDEVAGLNEAAYGDKSNEKSGKAIQARVAQQSLNLGEVFDNWRIFRLLIGRMRLALALKYWSPEKWARVAEVTLLEQHQETIAKAMLSNQPMPPQADLSWIPRAVASINSLLRFDVRLVDQAETSTELQAAMEQAIQLTGLLPDQAKAAIAPDIIRMSEFRGAEEMAAKAEQAMAPPPLPGPPPGMMPPQAPPVPPDGAFSLPPEGPPPVM